jgi:sterol desaturase/sphingolipid hydroxylase (fatty acid hydroxylase superfamily)
MQSVLDLWHRYWISSYYYIFFFIPFGLIIECLFSQLQPVKRIWLNMRVVFVNSVIVSALIPWVHAITDAATNMVGWHLIDLSRLAGQSIPLHILFGVMYVFILDIYAYWYHRAEHTFSWMWDYHLVHHSDDHVGVTTTNAQNWLTVAVFTLFLPVVTLPLAILFKFPIGSVEIAGLMYGFLVNLNHLDIKLSFGRWLSSPQFHHIHHSSLQEHADKNLANVFPILDVWFGTYWTPRPDEYPPTGLSNGEVIDSATASVVWPLKQWAKALLQAHSTS